MSSPLTAMLVRAGFVTVLLALVPLGGCMTQHDLVRLPTLRDVEPTGPEGKKCYDRCSQAEASCKHMCPGDGGICYDDCVMDTKMCLYDCPELRRPDAPK